MNWYRINHTNGAYLEVQALDEEDAKFQFYAQNMDIDPDTNEPLYVEQFLPHVKPIFVRVHLGFITVNLIPEIAEKLGYKEGDRFANEKAMFDAIGTQNIHIIELWYKNSNKDMPTDFFEAAKFMVESIQNTN